MSKTKFDLWLEKYTLLTGGGNAVQISNKHSVFHFTLKEMLLDAWASGYEEGCIDTTEEQNSATIKAP